jgi:hypothetical protein
MNGLPRLLQRLGVFAHSRDARGVRETLHHLSRNTGWDADVVRYIARLDGLDQSFVDSVLHPPPAADMPPSGMNERSQGAQPFVQTVTMDATSRILTPATSAEWDQVMRFAGISSGGPSFLWLMQESSGNLADSLSTATLTATGAPSYQQPVAGWSRKGVTFTDGGATVLQRTTAPVLDSATTSQLVIAYGFASSASVTRTTLQIGNATQQTLKVTTTTYQTISSTTATGAAALGSTARPLALINDVTNSRCAGYNDSDKMVPTYRAAAGATIGLIGNFTGGYLYGAAFQGSSAELTDAQIKRLLQTLGWTISWT